MQLRLTGPELLFLAAKGRALPPMVSGITWEDDAIRADVDLRKVPSDSRAIQLAANVASTIHLELTFAAFDPVTQVISFTLAAKARGIPGQRLLSLLTGPVNSAIDNALRARGLPQGLMTVHAASATPLVEIAAGQALSHFAQGTPLATSRLSSIRLAGGGLEAVVELPDHPR